eukprot:IDg15162t1
MRLSIPIPTWRQIAVAIHIILSASTHFHRGQDIRSNSLRLLSLMLEQKKEHSSFFCMPVLQLVGDFRFDASGKVSVTSAPALLKFVAACFRNLSTESLLLVMQIHTWVCDWALRVLRSETCSTQTVNLVIDVALGIVDVKKQVAEAPLCIAIPTSEESTKKFSDLGMGENLINVLSDTLKARLTYLRETSSNNWHRNKSNRDSFQSIMKVLAQMAMCLSLESEVMISLADSLLFIIT